MNRLLTLALAALMATLQLAAQVYLNREIAYIEQLQEHQAQITEGMRPAIYDPEHYPEDKEL